MYEETTFRPHCCPHCGDSSNAGVRRRDFLGAAALGGTMLAGLSWTALAAEGDEPAVAPARKPLVVQPILTHDLPQRRPHSSWRNWGGIETAEQAAAEAKQIETELAAIAQRADFPVKFLPLAVVRGAAQVGQIASLPQADAVIVYAAGGPMTIFDEVAKTGKDVIFFVRWKSGPVYLWYEIVSPRYLRQHTDERKVPHVREEDVVVDDQQELLWRLRALCGLRNTLGERILCVGGVGAWAQPRDTKVPELVRDIFKFDLQVVAYDELGKLISQARADEQAVARAKRRAAEYLNLPDTKLETELSYVENGFLLDDLFRGLMRKADCRAITINSCMGTIMPLAETSACLTLSTLNDDGYLAFCESDFVVIPSGVLMAHIAGKPVFLNDPTYPNAGIITLAHCTAPRKLDGKKRDPARILTHFESDYGAAPKVEMPRGQKVTNIIPDFAFKRWVGLLGEIVDSPFRPICRSQIDISFSCDSLLLAERMPGFHWMTCYGDYIREIGYALRRLGITWEVLG